MELTKGESVGFAVTGCGRMGRRRMSSILSHPHAELVSVHDTDHLLAQRSAQEFGAAAVSSVDELIADNDIHCIVICTPNRFHRTVVQAALNAGKHTFCEKPLAANPADARAMVESATGSEATLATGSNLRFFPNVIKSKDLIDRGAIGEPMFLRSWIGHQGWNLGETWYSDPLLAGGGTLLDNGCHIMDLTRWFLGEIRSCTGMVQTGLHPIRPMEDNGFGLFETVSGKTASIQASWTEWNGYCFAEIYGEEGYVRFETRGRKCVTVLGDRAGKEEVFDFSTLPANSYELEFAAYIDSVLVGEPHLTSGYDGMRAVQMASAVYESASTGRRIDIGADYTGKTASRGRNIVDFPELRKNA